MKTKYVIYHRGGGFLLEDGNYTDNVREARFFATREDAEIEISSYMEHVEEVAADTYRFN